MTAWKIRCLNCGDVTVLDAPSEKDAERRAKTKCENCGGASRELIR